MYRTVCHFIFNLVEINILQENFIFVQSKYTTEPIHRIHKTLFGIYNITIIPDSIEKVIFAYTLLDSQFSRLGDVCVCSTNHFVNARISRAVGGRGGGASSRSVDCCWQLAVAIPTCRVYLFSSFLVKISCKVRISAFSRLAYLGKNNWLFRESSTNENPQVVLSSKPTVCRYLFQIFLKVMSWTLS